MKNKLFPILLLISLLLQCLMLPSCKEEEKLQKYSDYSFEYFDTVSSIVGYAKDQEEFDSVSEYALSLLGEYHRLYTIYHRYEGLENLCTINDLKDGAHRTVKVDRRIIDMLLFSKEAYRLTNGAVNIAMGSVLSIWHDYRTLGSDDPFNSSLPPMEMLTEAAKHTDIECLVIDEESCTVTITDPKMKLDVGAIAKGYAVEMVAKALEDMGVTGYVLNVGGNVRAIGRKGDGTLWKVGIEDPKDTDGEYVAYLHISDQAIVTSGSYQRYYIVNGKRYHHIISKDTLMPAEGFLSVSVLCKNSAYGDALSTALFCMTLQDGLALVESMADTEVMWITSDGEKHFSSGFMQYTSE